MVIYGHMTKQKINVANLDLRLIDFFRRTFIPFARFSIFLIFFWFGFIKLLGLSPASSCSQKQHASLFHSLFFTCLSYVRRLCSYPIIPGSNLAFLRLRDNIFSRMQWLSQQQSGLQRRQDRLVLRGRRGSAHSAYVKNGVS